MRARGELQLSAVMMKISGYKTVGWRVGPGVAVRRTVFFRNPPHDCLSGPLTRAAATARDLCWGRADAELCRQHARPTSREFGHQVGGGGGPGWTERHQASQKPRSSARCAAAGLQGQV